MLGSGIMVLDAVATATTGVRKPHTFMHTIIYQQPQYGNAENLYCMHLSMQRKRRLATMEPTLKKSRKSWQFLCIYTIHIHAVGSHHFNVLISCQVRIKCKQYSSDIKEKRWQTTLINAYPVRILPSGHVSSGTLPGCPPEIRSEIASAHYVNASFFLCQWYVNAWPWHSNCLHTRRNAFKIQAL